MDKYPNNEDIIITPKRLFPKTQKMADPNNSGSVGLDYSEDGVVRIGRKRKVLRRINMAQSISQGGMRRYNKYIGKSKAEKEFEEEMKNSCHRCGLGISNYTYKHKKHYSMALCVRCNKLLDDSCSGTPVQKYLRNKYG